MGSRLRSLKFNAIVEIVISFADLVLFSSLYRGDSMSLLGKFPRRKLSSPSKKAHRRSLQVQLLELRQLMAVDVVEDAFYLNGSSALNVLTNDSNDLFVQSVSTANFAYRCV